MRGVDLRIARERLGATHQRIAELARVRTQDVADWEAGGVVPRKHRQAVDGALWQLERDAALRDSGLPECEFMAVAEERPWEIDGQRLVEHVPGCAACTARSEYVAAHVRPMPHEGDLVMRAVGVPDRLSGWQRSAAGGVMMLLMMGGVGVPILLVLGIVRREPTLLASALGLLVLLVASGAAGGIVHYLSAPLRERGRAGHYASWILTVYGYLFTVFALLSLAVRVFGPEVVGDDADLFSDPTLVVILLVLGAAFGLAAGRGAREAESPAAVEAPKRRWLTVRNGVVMLGVVLVAGARLAERFADPAPPRDWAAELPALQAAAQADPENVTALWELAAALGALERWPEAEAALESAARLAPGDANLLNDLAQARLTQGKWVEALPTLQQAVQADPEHPQANHNLAWTLYRSGRHEEAEAMYARAVTLAEHPDAVRGDRGWNLIVMRRLDDAAAEFREAIRLRPDNPWYHRGLAATLMQSGRPREALASYREAARLAPDDGGLHGEIGRLLHLLGDHPEAVREFEQADRLDPSYFRDRPHERGMWEASRAGRSYVPGAP